MAGKTMYLRAREVLKEYDGQTLHLEKLKLLISQRLASNPQSVTKYIKLLGDHGFIKEVEPFQYQIKISSL